MFGFKIVPRAAHFHPPTFEDKFANDGIAELYIDYTRIPTARRVSPTTFGSCHATYSYPPPGVVDPLSRAAGGWRPDGCEASSQIRPEQDGEHS